MKKDEVRPSLDDVEKISRGLAAKKRGTGSRAVPHRLNAEERIEWELAKKRKFVILRGTGYRKERGDSPLANVYRLYCDAVDFPFISLERGLGIDAVDIVKADFSPLRLNMDRFNEIVPICVSEAERDDDLRYGSLRSIQRETNILEIDQSALRDNAIWRLPALSVSFIFADRSESKRFAGTLTQLLSDPDGWIAHYRSLNVSKTPLEMIEAADVS